MKHNKAWTVRVGYGNGPDINVRVEGKTKNSRVRLGPGTTMARTTENKVTAHLVSSGQTLEGQRHGRPPLVVA